MKPVFNIERNLLEKELNISLPTDIWIKGEKLYLNCTDKTPFLIIGVQDDLSSIYIKKNNIEQFCKSSNSILFKKSDLFVKGLSYQEEVQLHLEALNYKTKLSIQNTKECILNNLKSDIRLSVSGGKDSFLCKKIVEQSIKEIKTELNIDVNISIDMFNTTNEYAENYRFVKEVEGLTNENIHTPEKGFYRWIEEDKKYFLPSTMVRNCCQKFKESRLFELFDKKENIVFLLGMRSKESSKRSSYDWYLNESIDKKLNVPPNWIRFLPIVNWETYEVWLKILKEGYPINEVYTKKSQQRCGCTICCYMSKYSMYLTKVLSPYTWNRWEGLLDKNYELFRVQRRLKWSRAEWRTKWKTGTSKEYELTKLKKTTERVEALAKIKNIPLCTADKFWDKTCICTDKKGNKKKLNPTEIAMFLKLFGRYDYIETDNRQFLCRDCLCKQLGISKEEYKNKLIEFSDSNCALF